LCAALRVSFCYRELGAPPSQSKGNSNSALIRPSGTFSRKREKGRQRQNRQLRGVGAGVSLEQLSVFVPGKRNLKALFHREPKRLSTSLSAAKPVNPELRLPPIDY
jgi:hypothetical protein